jgi:serine/threonine protein kinase
MSQRRHQVEDLFNQVLDCDPMERAKFLADACPDDPDLRAQVESLVSAHEMTGSFMDSPAYRLAADSIESANSERLIGNSVGHYQVKAFIDRGGMGDVYLAQDQKLHREVALKVLPIEFTEDGNRLRRFAQEARAASSLNHPNIITVYDVDQVGQTYYIATEFVDGKTLRKTISGGGMEVKWALDVVTQIARALGAAHAAGIVHRDIKPENVMIRSDNYVKVLDFGLAKLSGHEAQGGNESSLTKIHTDPGTRMGSTHYMSPEQARGLDVDSRSDIFSLGTVLYEIITGRFAFDGKSSADIIAAILKSEPTPIAKIIPSTPPELQRIVSKAISKDVEDRYQTIEEFLQEISAARQKWDSQSELTRLVTGSAIQIRRWRWQIAMVLMFTLVGGLALWIRQSSRHHSELQKVNQPVHAVPVAKWASAPNDSLSNPKFSPDGQMIAYSLIQVGNPEAVFIQEVNAGKPIPVVKDQWNNRNPVWSPDGQQLAFVSQRAGQIGIWTVPIMGGTPLLLTMIEDGMPTLKRWSKDGTKLFYEFRNNLFAIEINSKVTIKLTGFESSATNPKAFGISPNEDQIAYRNKNGSKFDIWVMSLREGPPIRLTDDPSDDFDPCWFPDGKRIAFTSLRGGEYQICVAYLDRREPVQITLGEGSYQVSDISTDASKILYTTFRDRSNIFSVGTDGDDEVEVITGLGVKFWPEVSPDGRSLVVQSSGESNALQWLYHSSIMVATISDPERQISATSDGYDPHWLPDGTRISFLRFSDADSKLNICTVDPKTGSEQQVTTGGVAATGVSTMPYNRIQTGGHGWSLDGSQLAYCSDKSGCSNVWISSSDGTNDKNLTNNTDPNLAFSCPCWSPDNTRIAFLSLFIGSGGKNSRWSVVMAEKEKNTVLFSSDSYVRLLGWSPSGRDVFIGWVKGTVGHPGGVSNVGVRQVSVLGTTKNIVDLKAVYVVTLCLSQDRSKIAFVSRQDGADNIWMIRGTSGEAHSLTRNNSETVYYSSPAWSADGHAVFYGRQERWRLVSMIDNFR